MRGHGLWGLSLLVAVMATASAEPSVKPNAAREDLEPFFDDAPRAREVRHPDWFKLSFLDLRNDLSEAVKAGKRGLMVYFGQEGCAYCQTLMKVNFTDPDIVAYTKAHFDAVAVDIRGDRELITLEGEVTTEKAFSTRERTNFTPSLLFFDSGGQAALKLRGYHAPYTFRAALEYVADGHHQRETFREYFERATPPMDISEAGLTPEDFFEPPPYVLDRTRVRAQRPLLVLFEQNDCHSCDILHTSPLSDEGIIDALKGFDVVQIHMWADTPVLTPDGQRSTARAWAARLGLFHAPSLVFFDEAGVEVLRIDSVIRLFRLAGVLEFVASGAYRQYPTYQRWRASLRAQRTEATE